MLKSAFMVLVLVASSTLAAQAKHINAPLNLAPLKACLDKLSFKKTQECTKQFSASLTPKQKSCVVQITKDCKQDPTPCINESGAPNRLFIAANDLAV